MKFDDYQKKALTTALKNDDKFMDLTHWVLGVNGEAGEIAEKLKKIIRDKNGVMTKQDKVDFAKEIGDVLWYLAVLSDHLGLSFDDVAVVNLQKLADRKVRHAITGSGDNR